MTRTAAYKSRLARAEAVLRELGITQQISEAIERLDGVARIDTSNYTEESLRLIKRAANALGYDIREYDDEFEETKILLIDFSTLD